MILDAEMLVSDNGRTSSFTAPILSFLQYIEKKLGVRIVRDSRDIPFGRADLVELLLLVEQFKKAGIIASFGPALHFPDEPRLKRWNIISNNTAKHPATGASPDSDTEAILAALGEALERYLWMESDDYLVSPVRLSFKEMKNLQDVISPYRFAAFSKEQRDGNNSLHFDENTPFVWTKGHSLVRHQAVYLPAQVASGNKNIRTHAGTIEPFIRYSITTGVATWPTQTGAQLRGALEIIERDAYMITWLNQLTPPRIDVSNTLKKHARLARLFEDCERYRLKPHVLRLVTDAPAYAMCVVLEDMSDVGPRFALGMKAHHSLAHAIEKATVEALRARSGYRNGARTWDPTTLNEKIGHIDRLYYWGDPHNASNLEFLIQGNKEMPQGAPWDSDSESQHLQRIVEWCKKKDYECIAVSLGASSKNPSKWFVESMVIPELQPTYLDERMRQTSGTRLKNVPMEMGYTPRAEPFIQAPHPFA